LAEVLLIPGRTTRQGVGANIGKESAEFREATAYIEVSVADASAAGLTDAQATLVRSPFGEVRVPCRVKPAAELPAGLAFMPYGPVASRLMGAETHGTGMPDSKHLQVTIQPAPAEGGNHP
jgi:formylmethanofuran dehydrogenase subunit D